MVHVWSPNLKYMLKRFTRFEDWKLKVCYAFVEGLLKKMEVYKREKNYLKFYIFI